MYIEDPLAVLCSRHLVRFLWTLHILVPLHRGFDGLRAGWLCPALMPVGRGPLMDGFGWFADGRLPARTC
jgi:hypothetical protein